jgi:hypothetical protein
VTIVGVGLLKNSLPTTKSDRKAGRP